MGWWEVVCSAGTWLTLHFKFPGIICPKTSYCWLLIRWIFIAGGGGGNYYQPASLRNLLGCDCSLLLCSSIPSPTAAFVQGLVSGLCKAVDFLRSCCQPKIYPTLQQYPSQQCCTRPIVGTKASEYFGNSNVSTKTLGSEWLEYFISHKPGLRLRTESCHRPWMFGVRESPCHRWPQNIMKAAKWYELACLRKIQQELRQSQAHTQDFPFLYLNQCCAGAVLHTVLCAIF